MWVDGSKKYRFYIIYGQKNFEKTKQLCMYVGMYVKFEVNFLR